MPRLLVALLLVASPTALAGGGPPLYRVQGTSGDDVVVGTRAGERILGWTGDDRLEGRGGHDDLDGGLGDDRVLGGPGNNLLSGGHSGRDRIWAANGRRDRVGCGPGRDQVRSRDPQDAVARDCEAVAEPTRPLALAPTHRVVAAACRSLGSLGPACPGRLPRGFYARSGVFATAGAKIGAGYDSFSVESFRPRHVHVTLYAGNALFRGGGPFAGRAAPRIAGLRNGLTRERRDRILFLGVFDRRALYLDVPYPNGGMTGGHLFLYWRARGLEYALSLHAWDPLLQAVATLRAVAASMPPPAR